MEINATAYLVYRDGESIASGWERLDLVVKFKETGKLLKTKLVSTLVSTFEVSYENKISIEEYYDLCEFYLSDTYTVKRRAEDMIKNYFKEKYKEESNEARSTRINKQVAKSKPITVTVKIN